jgi:predicted nucleic acid-binding protein
VIVLGEYRFGISPSRDRVRYEQWLSNYLPRFRILDVDEQTTHHYATLRAELKRSGKLIPINDAWIAALCRQHSMPLLSRDRHFDAVAGVSRITW